MPIARFRMPRLLLPVLLFAAAAFPAHAELVLRLSSPHALPGATVELEGLLVNDTGNALSSPIATELTGQWTDARGQVRPAHFTLRTSPEPASLPTNTFTRMVWTGTVPADAHGLLTLTVQGADNTLLALQTGGATQLAQASGPAPQAGPAVLSDQAPAAPAVSGVAPTASAPLSPFETFRNALSPYEPMYFIMGRDHGANARFQVSFKYRPFSPTDAAHPDFIDNWYFGYTQTSLWDLHSDSIPFVDTTYNPSLFWARDSLWETADKRWSVGLNAGLEHLSNGKEGDDSRSLNDYYLQPQFSYRFDGGSTLSFQPRFKLYAWTDPDMRYPDSLGRVDWKVRWAQDDGLILSALYRQGAGGRSATQVEAAWPLKRTFLHMNGYLYAQYFQGYGETLLNYDQKHDPQVRIGIALVP